MIAVIKDFKQLFLECKSQDFAFYMAAGYLVFSYLRPQVIFPALDFLPWTQLCIMAGLISLAVNQRLKIQPVHSLTFVFFLIVLASSYSSLYPETSFSKMDVAYIWLLEMFFFTNCIKNRTQFKLLTLLFFLVLFKMSLFGAKTWISRGFGFTNWGIAGPTGFFANSGEFSLLMAMLAVMSLTFILGHRKINKLYYILPITAITTVLGASSRGGQLALLVGLLVISVVIGKIRIKNILIMSLVGYVVFLIIPEEQKLRFTNMGEDDTSSSRIVYWEKGMEMMEKYPYLGVGHNSFPEYYADHYSDPTDDTFLGKRKEVEHNSFIQVGSTLGYTGLACYVGMCLLCYRQNRKTRKLLKQQTIDDTNEWCHRYSIGLDTAMLVYLVGSFFMSVAFYPYLYFLMMFSQSLLNSVRGSETSPARQKSVAAHTKTLKSSSR